MGSLVVAVVDSKTQGGWAVMDGQDRKSRGG